MIALISFIVIILLSLVVVKIGGIALEATGLSRDVAQFQAQSAFTGVGFTTSESEFVTATPIRRKIIKMLMLLGSAGLTTAIATLVFTFVNSDKKVQLINYEISYFTFNMFIIGLVLVLIFITARTKTLDKFIRWMMEKPLHSIKKSMVYDYERIFGLSHGYSIVTFEVPKRHWMVNKTINQLEMQKEGIDILGVYRNIKKKEEYIGLPSDDFKIHKYDKIIAYGREEAISNVAKREKGSKGTKDRKQAETIHQGIETINKVKEKEASEVTK